MSELPHDEAPGPDRSVKVGHLVTGLVFVGLAATWLLRADSASGEVDVAVLVPVVLVLAGLVGLVTVVAGNARRSRRRRRAHAAAASTPAPGPETDTDTEIHRTVPTPTTEEHR